MKKNVRKNAGMLLMMAALCGGSPALAQIPNWPVCADKGYTIKTNKEAVGTTTAMTYTWTIAGATASTTTTTYRRTLSTTGSNAYSVTVRNSNGCVSDASPAKTITINGPAGINQAVACGCASGLTACNDYCRNLAADGAVCYNNRKIIQLCVDYDNVTNCPEWEGFTRVTYSTTDTQAILKLIGIEAHAMWAAQTDGIVCRYARRMESCYCYNTNSIELGWFGRH
jgi:hypothetical protein